MAGLPMMNESHLLNCSAMGHTAVYPCKALAIVMQYHSPDAVSLTLEVSDPFVSIKTDIHKICFFDHGALKSQSISRKLEKDKIVYEDILSNHSQEIHWIRVRQQNPLTQLWSMCEIRVFASDHGRRTSVCVEWFYVDIFFEETTKESISFHGNE